MQRRVILRMALAGLVGVVCAANALAATWQEALATMPLYKVVPELNRSNAVPLMLLSFQKNAEVKALIFMPGATDEFNFFRRAVAQLTNSKPTLLDAVVAL